MKLRYLYISGIVLIWMVTLFSACSSKNSPTTENNLSATPTPSPVPTPTAKPVYYYSVYYTATCSNCILDPGSVGAVDYKNSSGNMIENTNTFLPFTSSIMTFYSGQNLYIFASMSAGEVALVNIYINGTLAFSNSGDPSAVISETLE